jgi:3-oxoacyl-[acyl-carrier protein] reductase
VSVLINTAGVTNDSPLVTMTSEDWHRVIDTNLNGVFNVCRAFIYPMIRQRFGKIINVSSTAALLGVRGQTNYCASKAGIDGFTRALALEVARYSITVNCVSPGYTDTRMIAALTPQQRESALARIPMGRFGTPEDVAGLCCFLASSAADYVTGQSYAIDGGLTA